MIKLNKRKAFLFLLNNIFGIILIMTTCFLKLELDPLCHLAVISLLCMIYVFIKLFHKLDNNENKVNLIYYNMIMIITIGMIEFNQSFKPLLSMFKLYYLLDILLVAWCINLLFYFITCSCRFVFDGIEEKAETSN